MEPIIRAENVYKTYETGKVKVHALRGLNLQVYRGEMIAVMGPSGCGKTTLLNCLSGMDEITSGRIFIDNTELGRMSDRDRTTYRGKHMGFVFQFYNLLPVLTALENIELPLLVTGVRPSEARKRAQAAIEQVGLERWMNHRPAELSGGQRQRVTIARALVTNPKIVWADEPTGDLDSGTADEIMALMRDLNQRNRQTFIIVTHDQRIGDMCNRIVHMRDGVVVEDGRKPVAVETSDGQIVNVLA